MIKFCEDLANKGVVGRCYISNGADITGAKDSKGLVVKVNSLDVAYSEIHYTLFSKEGKEIGNFGCPIAQFTLFEKVSGTRLRLYMKVFPPHLDG